MPTLRVLRSVREAPAAAWDTLVGADGAPFLEWTWLDALEEAGTVTRATGWLPQHLTLWEGEALVGACPLYVKGHSMGEFVFDQGWAQAAERAGIRYYPKLLVAVPFTPAAGTRFLACPGREREVIERLGAVLEDLCGEQGFSSAHVNFCRPHEVDALVGRGWLGRLGYQYVWRNEGFHDFDDYLASLRAKRRNQVKRERRALGLESVEVVTLAGDAIPGDAGRELFRLYEAGVDRHVVWGRQYLTARFFDLLVERYRARLCLVLARQGGRTIAGTINVQTPDAFYGRYWGAFREVRHLHFNVCYYAAIEHCIRQGIARFEPGAGGEFKHLRGFEATATASVHWVRDERLRAAVADFLRRERRAVEREIGWWDAHSARKRGDAEEEPGEA